MLAPVVKALTVTPGLLPPPPHPLSLSTPSFPFPSSHTCLFFACILLKLQQLMHRQPANSPMESRPESVARMPLCCMTPMASPWRSRRSWPLHRASMWMWRGSLTRCRSASRFVSPPGHLCLNPPVPVSIHIPTFHPNLPPQPVLCQPCFSALLTQPLILQPAPAWATVSDCNNSFTKSKLFFSHVLKQCCRR